jgi:hypothetical protein
VCWPRRTVNFSGELAEELGWHLEWFAVNMNPL